MNEQKIVIRKLAPKDWKGYRSIRLQALTTDPAAFGRLHSEDVKLTKKIWQERLRGSKLGRLDMYGAFARGTLIATAGVRFEPGAMFRHMATLKAMYVDPAFRGRGVGSSLLRHILKKLRHHSPIVKVRLSVNKPQKAAIKLYEKMGFKEVGLSRYEARIGKKWLDQIQMDMIFKEKL